MVERRYFHRLFLKALSLAYAGAAVFHLLDLLDLRLRFSEMDTLWKTWTLYLFTGDILVALALWRPWKHGEVFFVLVALSQLYVFLGWAHHFGNQYPRILFHLVTLGTYLVILTYRPPIESQS